jgi:hypothetical protein
VRHSLLDLGNGLSRIEVLRADLGAVHDGVAPVELEGVVEVVQPLRRHLVAGILDPPVGLHQNGRSQVLVGVPPVGRTGSRAAGAEDALVHAIELGPVFLRLEEFTLELGVSVSPGQCPRRPFGSVDVARLQPGLDGTVLFVEIAHVRDQILENVHVREGIYFGGCLSVVVDIGQTGEGVASLDVHGAGSADSLPATPAKGEARVLLVLDLDEGVQNHRTAIVQVDRIRAEVGLLVVLFRVPSIDLKVLDALFGRRLVDGALEIGFRGKRGSL